MKVKKRGFLGIFNVGNDQYQKIINDVGSNFIENLINYTEDNGDEVRKIGNSMFGVTNDSLKDNQGVWQYLDNDLYFLNLNHPSVYDSYIKTIIK